MGHRRVVVAARVGERSARARADGMDVQAVAPWGAARDADVDAYHTRRVLPKLRGAYPGPRLIEKYRVCNEGGRSDRCRAGRHTTRQGDDGEHDCAGGPSKRDEHLRFSVLCWKRRRLANSSREHHVPFAGDSSGRRTIPAYLALNSPLPRPDVEMLRLRALGGLALECDGTRLESVAGRRRALALLAQLAVAGPRGISRARLVHRLWPDSDEDKARNVLAQTLHKLKRDIAGAEIVTGTNELRLDDALVSTDVGDFERHASAGQLEQAARLYEGPFLDGFYVNGADEFERWAEEERSRLARLAGETFEALAQQADRAGDIGTAVTWWRRLAALDPLATRATLGLMTALAASGDTADALRVGSVYQALVGNELDAPPDPAIERLANEIRSGALAPVRALVIPLAEPGTPAAPAAPAGEPNESASPPVAVSRAAARPRRRLPWYVGVGVVAAAAVAYASTRPASSVELAPPPAAAIPVVGSIAVLPLVNLGQSTADDYLADGEAEELANALSRV